MRGPTARGVAADVLVRVERDKAFASAALEAELSRAVQLSPRDRALATELVYGSLRVAPWLTARIDKLAKRPVSSQDSKTRAHLLIAAYQLFFLSRVPPFAAVSEAVGAIRVVKGKEVAAFANAILRKLATQAEIEKPDPVEAVRGSTSPELRAALVRSLGEEGASSYLASGLTAPAIGIRVQNATERDAWIARFREAAPDAEFSAGAVSPLAILVRHAGKPHDLPGFAEGAWAIQEEGSQLVGLALGARPGEEVLDTCAGRGNKTGILARAVLPGGAVDASDLHETKLDRLRIELARLALSPRTTYAVDWSVGSGEVTALYDRVLVDAPCSGTGTMRRRPELASRRGEADVSALTALQLAIASRSADRLRVGGTLVYAVCSVLREEGEDIVARLLASRPDLTASPFAGEAAAALAKDACTLRLLPYVHGTDGYFLASFHKER
jgi:16S rRNA (cytosine967-C5)-methyltransferase